MLRYLLLSTHYRSPLDFSDQSLKEAKNALNGFYDLFTRLAEPERKTGADTGVTPAIERCRREYRRAMDDDFNTPVAIAELQRLRSILNKLLGQGLSTDARKIAREEFRSLGNNFGLFQLDKWQFGSSQTIQPAGIPSSEVLGTVPLRTEEISEEEIEAMLRERNEARSRKDFKRADEIRQSLTARGIIIEDKPDGTSRWKR
jgi:cysteinyl-tRNA synthetase